MSLESFFSDALNEVSKQERESKTIIEILNKKLPTTAQGLEKFKEAYDNNEPWVQTMFLTAIPQILDLWGFEGFEYSKIFDFNHGSEKEDGIANLIGSLAFGKPMHKDKSTNYRLPDVLHKLVTDGHLLPEEISPELEDKYPTEYECITTSERVATLKVVRKHKLNEKIHKRIRQRLDSLVFTDRNLLGTGTKENSQALTHRRGINLDLMRAKPVQRFEEKTIDEVTALVKQRGSFANNLEMPLKSYGAILKLTPDQFMDTHYISLNLNLDMEFVERQYSNKIISKKEMIDTKGETFVQGTVANKKIRFDLSLHPDYAILIFYQNVSFGDYEKDNDKRLYAEKLMLESYCMQKKIKYYSEIGIYDDTKIGFLKKIETLQYVNRNLKEISPLLTDEAILKIIDYSNHTTALTANISTMICLCGKPINTGMFKHSRDGMVQIEEVAVLKNNNIRFPISQLHIIHEHPQEYNPRVNELETINELLVRSKNWELITIPEELYDDYIACFLGFTESKNASRWQIDEFENGNSMPNYTKEEMEVDPIAKSIMEDQVAAEYAIKGPLESVKDKVKVIYDALTSKLTTLPIQYQKDIETYASGVYGTIEYMQYVRRDFVESTYNTFKAAHNMNPTRETLNVILAIESQQKN